MDISQELARILSRSDFTAFMERFLREADISAWENVSVAAYLDAVAAAAGGLDRLSENRGGPSEDAPTWRLFAEIIVNATLYD